MWHADRRDMRYMCKAQVISVLDRFVCCKLVRRDISDRLIT